MNQENARKQFKERLGFEEWGDRQPDEPNVFFLNFFLTGEELPSWELVRARRPVEEGPVTARKWFWEPAGEGEENVRLHLDTFECPSQRAAHEQVVSLLGHVQGPPLTPLEDGPGDVSFGPENGETSVILARGNLTLRVLNAGDDVVGVGDLAEELDSLLSEPPVAKDDAVPGPRIEEVGLEDRDGYRQLILIAEDPIQDETVGFRIFSAGTVSRSDDEIRYEASPEETGRMQVYALNKMGGVSSETIDLGKE